ncbi:MAG: hypothetical protein IKE22_08025, partial [Atopobiaceae bacterium]|nr:hypothetical protein [Atopobiaceae bacterium]
MTYKLPDGMSFVNTSGEFVMDFGGRLGKLEHNTYEIRDGILYVRWNTSDETHMKILRAADNAFFSFDVTGEYDSQSGHIKWSDEIETEVSVTEPHNATIEKSGTYNEKTGKIEYTLTITSEGRTTDIAVTDTITGTALTSDVNGTADLTVERKKKDGTVETVTDFTLSNVTDKGFTFGLSEMADGDVVTIKYTASVDYTKLSGNGKTSITETYNGVKLDWKENGDNPPEEDSNYEYEINYSSLNKEATEVGDEITDPVTGEKYRIITWKITANEQRKVPVTHIKDSIGAAASRSIMKMDGAGITVTVTKEDGTTETRPLAWDSPANEDGRVVRHDDYSWTYYPPATDGKYKYEITYTTKVNTTNIHTVTAVDNDVEHDHDEGHGGEGITPGEGSEVTLTKEVSEVTEGYVIWDIYASVPAEGYSDFKIVEQLPKLNDIGVYDYWDKTFGDAANPGVKVVSGLVDGETITAEVSQTGSTWRDGVELGPWDQEVTIAFYNDGQPGVARTGSARTIHLQIKTLNNTEWLEYAASNEHAITHTNTVKIPGTQILVSKPATIQNKVIKKEYEGTTDVWVNDGAELKQVRAFRYTVTLTGASENSAEFLDYFDTDLFEVLNPNNVHAFWSPNEAESWWIRYGTHSWDSGTKTDPRNNAVFTPIDGGVSVKLNNLPKDPNNVNYGMYKVSYYLYVKDPTALAQKMLEDGGSTLIKNKAVWDDSTSEVKFEYGNPIVDK